jgi:hypothetical protein
MVLRAAFDKRPQAEAQAPHITAAKHETVDIVLYQLSGATLVRNNYRNTN